MTSFTAPGFQIGDRVFLADGRSGVITASQFSDDGGFWEYLVDPLFFFVPEFDLSLTDPAAVLLEPPPDEDVELPPTEERDELVGFVTRADLRALVLEVVRTGTGAGVTHGELVNEVDRGRDQAIAAAGIMVQAQREEISAATVELSAERAAQFQDLESTVTTVLSEIEKRSTDLEREAEETSGFGFFGFVGGLGGLLKNPVDWIMSRLGDHIASEVNDGLNR